jgi:hypothetical protein
MPLPIPDPDITALQQAKLIAHLSADPIFSPLINLPILPYPPDGIPATHPERCASIWYLDSDNGYADNASNKLDNIFTVRVQIKEASESQADIEAAHQIAMNLKDILLQALWRYRKDDCLDPPALWWRMQFTIPAARVTRKREQQLQVVEVSFRITSTHPNRPR